MIIQFTTTPYTLGDDLAQITAGVRITVELENWGLTAKVQEEDLPEPSGGVPFYRPLGNLKGPFSFTAKQTFASFALGAAAFGNALALVNTQDTLVVMPYGNTSGNKKFSYANSVLESVKRNISKSNGVLWAIQYNFRIGAQTITTI